MLLVVPFIISFGVRGEEGVGKDIRGFQIRLIKEGLELGNHQKGRAYYFINWGAFLGLLTFGLRFQLPFLPKTRNWFGVLGPLKLERKLWFP